MTAAPASAGPRRAGRSTVASLGAVLVMTAATALLWILNRETQGAETDFGTRLTPLVLAADGLIFSVVAVMILSKRPGNAVGRVCLLIGMMIGLNTLAIEYSVHALLTDPGGLPGGHLAAWLANWTWVLYIALLGAVLVLLFPDGRLPSPRWRPVLATAVLATAMAATSFAFAPGRFVSLPWAVNPFGISSLPALEVLGLGFFLLAATIVAAAWSMVLRYRRARGDQRQQIKWFASATSLVAVLYVGQAVLALVTGTLGNSGDSQRIFQTAVVAVFGVVAGAVGVAVMRYRLYQIDRVISRTVTYTLVTGALGGLYGALVFGLGRVIPGDSDLALVTSTLAVAALFAPVRRRVQASVDRRFNRTRHDAARALERFSEQLRHATDLTSLRSDLADAAAQIMEPVHVSLWLEERR